MCVQWTLKITHGTIKTWVPSITPFKMIKSLHRTQMDSPSKYMDLDQVPCSFSSIPKESMVTLALSSDIPVLFWTNSKKLTFSLVSMSFPSTYHSNQKVGAMENLSVKLTLYCIVFMAQNVFWCVFWWVRFWWTLALPFSEAKGEKNYILYSVTIDQ